MKLKIALALGLLSLTSHAATSFSGSGVVGAKTSTGLANVPSTSLALLIVDIGNNGFLGMDAVVPGSLLQANLFDPHLAPAQAALVAGQLFGGDKIITVTTSGSSGSIAALLPSQDISAYFGMKYAVVWFDGVNTVGAPALAAAGTKYGIIRGNDWTFPVADVAGALTFNSTDSGGASTLFQANGGTRAGTTTAGFMSTISGGTGTGAAASFVVVPEPSAALLGAIGALGLLRRRRN